MAPLGPQLSLSLTVPANRLQPLCTGLAQSKLAERETQLFAPQPSSLRVNPICKLSVTGHTGLVVQDRRSRAAVDVPADRWRRQGSGHGTSRVRRKLDVQIGCAGEH